MIFGLPFGPALLICTLGGECLMLLAVTAGALLEELALIWMIALLYDSYAELKCRERGKNDP